VAPYLVFSVRKKTNKKQLLLKLISKITMIHSPVVEWCGPSLVTSITVTPPCNYGLKICASRFFTCIICAGKQALYNTKFVLKNYDGF
jgi:hypothetical protein